MGEGGDGVGGGEDLGLRVAWLKGGVGCGDNKAKGRGGD